MKIEVLGPGCLKCQNLEENVRQAVKELGLDAKIEKVTDMGRIMGYGIISTPGLVVDGKVVGYGRLFSVEEIKRMLS